MLKKLIPYLHARFLCYRYDIFYRGVLMHRNALGNWKLWLLFTQTNTKPPHRQVHSIFLYFRFFHFVGTFLVHIGQYTQGLTSFPSSLYESCRSQTTFIIFLLAFHIRSQIHLTCISCYTHTYFFAFWITFQCWVTCNNYIKELFLMHKNSFVGINQCI